MGKIFITPITDEQRRAAENKRAAKADAERKNEQDLINAALLEEVERLKGLIQNDRN